MKKIEIIAFAALGMLALVSCNKEKEDGFSDSARVRVCIEAEELVSENSGKAVFSTEGGFTFKAGDVISFTPDGSQTSVNYTITEDVKEAEFEAEIPGLASHDVTGVFSCNMSGSIPKEQNQFSAGVMDKLSLISQPVVIKKNTEQVKVTVGFAGAVLKVCPFGTGLSESVVSVSVNDYKVTLDGPYAVPSTLSDGVFLTVPASSYEKPVYVVTTDKGEYTFKSSQTKQWAAGTVYSLNLNIAKATSYVHDIDLGACTISTNNPMLYVGYDFTPQGTWGADSGDENRPIEWIGGAVEERQAKWDSKANLWDNDATTSFHTNFDIYQTDGSWAVRDGAIIDNNYIQISFLGTVGKFSLEWQNPSNGDYLIGSDVSGSGGTGYGVDIQVSSDGNSFSSLSGFPKDFSGAAPGSKHKFENLSNGNRISAIRILPAQGITTVGSINQKGCYAAGYFGIAELAIKGDYVPAGKVSVTGVSLSESSVSLTKGASTTLKATVLPESATDKSVSWKSDKPAVATVANGVVTAVSAGTAKITVTTTDGGYTASCNVSVTEKSEYPEGVTVVKTDDYAYAIVDFSKNSKLKFNVSYIDGAAPLSTHFNNFDKSKGTPILATNADFFWDYEGKTYSVDLVMTGGNIKQAPAYQPVPGYFPARAALGLNNGNRFEITWVRGPGDMSAVYSYPEPYPYTSGWEADSDATGRQRWLAKEAVGGGPVIVDGGKNVAIENYGKEKQNFNGGDDKTCKTSRTCYGFIDGDKGDMKVMVILVQKDISLYEAGQRMIELGCKKAMNFDGGGSSEMLGIGGVKLRPQEWPYERSMPSAIIISVLD